VVAFAGKEYVSQIIPVRESGKIDVEDQRQIVFVPVEIMDVPEIDGMDLTRFDDKILVRCDQVYAALEAADDLEFGTVSVGELFADAAQFRFEWQVSFVFQ